MNEAEAKKRKPKNKQNTNIQRPTKSMVHLYKHLKAAGALQDTRLKMFNQIGSNEVEWEENFIKQLIRPSFLFHSIIEMWCSFNNISYDEEQNEINYGIPLIIKHRVQLIQSTWQANLIRFTCHFVRGVNFQNADLISESIQNWEQLPKDRVISDLLKIFQATSTSVYIHKGFLFPTVDPEIINNGLKYVTHLIENEGYYWPTAINKKSRYQLKKFYEQPLDKRKRLVLAQADWTIPLKNNLEGIHLLEELSQKRVQNIPEPIVSNQEHEEVFGKLNSSISSRQRSLEIEGYQNLHLGLDSLQKIIPLSLLKKLQINIITFYPSIVQKLGQLWSYFYFNNLLTVQIVTDNKSQDEQRIVRKTYETIKTQIQNPHLILCENCQDVLATKEQLNKHREQCQRRKSVSTQSELQ